MKPQLSQSSQQSGEYDQDFPELGAAQKSAPNKRRQQKNAAVEVESLFVYEYVEKAADSGFPSAPIPVEDSTRPRRQWGSKADEAQNWRQSAGNKRFLLNFQ